MYSRLSSSSLDKRLQYHSRHVRSIRVNILDPDEGVVELWVYGLQVLEGQRFVQNTLVEGQGESSVDELAVEQSLKGTNKPRHVRFAQ